MFFNALWNSFWNCSGPKTVCISYRNKNINLFLKVSNVFFNAFTKVNQTWRKYQFWLICNWCNNGRLRFLWLSDTMYKKRVIGIKLSSMIIFQSIISNTLYKMSFIFSMKRAKLMLWHGHFTQCKNGNIMFLYPNFSGQTPILPRSLHFHRFIWM